MKNGTAATMSRPRLNHLETRPLKEGQSLVYTPSGAFEIAAPPTELAAVLAHCDGNRDMEAILASTANPEGYREVIGALAAETRTEPETPRFRVEKLWFLGDEGLIQKGLNYWGPAASSTDLDGLERALAAGETDGLLVVVVNSIFDRAVLTAVNDLCAKAGVRWTQFHFDRGKGWLGPLVIPGETADYRDLIGRRLCTGDHIEAALLEQPITPEQGAPCPLERPSNAGFAWMLGLFFAEIAKAAAGKPCRLFSAELEADPATGATALHAFLPLPTRAPQTLLSSAPTPEAMLVDRRAGVALSQHQVEHHPSVPASLVTVRTHCADLARVYPWGNDLFVGGSSFSDEPAARGASLGEALERYCGNCLPGTNTRRASYRELMAAGEHAIDPESLILHSESMLKEPGCPFTPFTRDLPVHWVCGRSVTRDRPAWMPVSLVYANWQQGDMADEPTTHYLYTPGMAAGRNMEQAMVGAIRELVERDATMAWWLNGVALPAVEIPPELDTLWDGAPRQSGQEYRLIHLDNEFGIPVMVGVVENRREGWLNIGFGCRPDPIEAAKKAWTEALTLQEGSRDLNEPDSTLRKSAEEWGLLSVSYKPWRKDRLYLDEYRDDFRDVSDLMLQQQVFLDPRAIERVRPLTNPRGVRRFEELPRLPDDRFETYRSRIEARGFEIFAADITSPDIALTPFRATRVIVPGLIPNMPAAFPAVGGRRVFDLPVALGWRDEPLSEDQLNYFPMPHA